MKTAKEYAIETGTCNNVEITQETGVSFLIKEIEQIQLDAFKAGALWVDNSFIFYSPILSATIKDNVNNLTQLPPNQ